MRKAEIIARWLGISLTIGISLAVIFLRWSGTRQVTIVHARMPEAGGWLPADLTATVGEPLHLRLTSDDVLHGFAIGQSDSNPVDVKPGEVTPLTLTFDQPGKYTFYCTRWCGPNHWRMRGTIQVSPKSGIIPQTTEPPEAPPLYVTLGLDLDAPRHAEAIPSQQPVAADAEDLAANLPAAYKTQDYYRSHSPEQAFQELRADPFNTTLTDQQAWNLVAWIWRHNTSTEKLSEASKLYAPNCAACHGETGAGDGVFAADIRQEYPIAMGHSQPGPVDFTDSEHMLATSPAILHGKIVRGGMGTGMPYWGPIFTDDEIWALVDYLWIFQFNYGAMK